MELQTLKMLCIEGKIAEIFICRKYQLDGIIVLSIVN